MIIHFTIIHKGREEEEEEEEPGEHKRCCLQKVKYRIGKAFLYKSDESVFLRRVTTS